ncbi:MAG TPA: ester cyclase [Solirubrobacteraceae bacterium]|nr:ester cyclase [Solirubrobacteraceae bacterium]
MPTSQEEQNKQVVQGMIRAINEHRLRDLPVYMASDVVDHNKIIHGEANEPGAAFDAFRQQLEAFGEFAVSAEELTAEGDRVAAQLRVRGTHTGTHPRMPLPTGRSFEIEQIWVLTVAGGKVTEIRAVSDRLGLFLQLGWDWPTAE